SRRRHTRFSRDWSSDVCSSDLRLRTTVPVARPERPMMPLISIVGCEPLPMVSLPRVSSHCSIVLKTSAAAETKGLMYSAFNGLRSEERRVGKEYRAWRETYHKR